MQRGVTQPDLTRRENPVAALEEEEDEDKSRADGEDGEKRRASVFVLLY